MLSSLNEVKGDFLIKIFAPIMLASIIKTQLIKKRQRAPNKNRTFPLAKPQPAVQIGGIRAVAMATPGTILFT